MVFEFGQYKVDIDVERTRSFYENASLVSEGCSCDGCQNFEKAAGVLPESVGLFFSRLGIDMEKVCEVYVNCVNDDGTLLYGGFYHACGTVISGKSAWMAADHHISYWEDQRTFHITQDFHVSFTEECALLEEEFPLPALQIEIYASIPWVLEKENHYI